MQLLVARPMEIPDLELSTFGCARTLAYCDDLPIEEEDQFGVLRGHAVGWLGSTVPTVGESPEWALPALTHLATYQYIDGGDLGVHDCEVCNGWAGRGELLLRTAKRSYVAPVMVIHYVRDHSYLPPEEFLTALGDWWHANRACEPSAPPRHPYLQEVQRPPSVWERYTAWTKRKQ